MAIVEKTALVPYSPEQMFCLVGDVDAYSHFLPWCKASRLVSRKDNHVEAEITIAHGKLEKTFSTHNTLQPFESMDIRLHKGPFSHLHGIWNFHALGDDGCKVSLHMEFEISNPLLRVTLGPIFSHLINTLIDAFVQRADELYGKR